MELRNGEQDLEEVKIIGAALSEDDTSVNYAEELDLLLDTFSILADSISDKAVLTAYLTTNFIAYLTKSLPCTLLNPYYLLLLSSPVVTKQSIITRFCLRVLR